VTDKTSGLLLQNYVDKVEAGRAAVGRGPMPLTNATDKKSEKLLDILAVPLRFVSRKSRSALAVPSNFNPAEMIGRSNCLPNYGLVR
jgi:hypothetical protein